MMRYLKISFSALLPYLMDGVTAEDFAALPLILVEQPGGYGYALQRVNGELYAREDRIDQVRAARAVRACVPD
jgi:hypothetical protein